MRLDTQRCGTHLLRGALMAGLLAVQAGAAPPIYEIEIRNHLFQPDVVTIPAGVKIKLVVHNQDETPEEFESFELNREKVIMGHATVTIFVGPLAPGEYPFVGEFNPNTAIGKIVATGNNNADQ